MEYLPENPPNTLSVKPLISTPSVKKKYKYFFSKVPISSKFNYIYLR
jgi:hypothetical protein